MRNNFRYWNFLQISTNLELQLQFLFKFEIQKNWPLRDVGPTVTNSPLIQTGQGVLHDGLQILVFDVLDMHRLNHTIEEDIEFSKVLTAKQLPKKD
jgi:hypothetical protein